MGASTPSFNSVVPRFTLNLTSKNCFSFVLDSQSWRATIELVVTRTMKHGSRMKLKNSYSRSLAFSETMNNRMDLIPYDEKDDAYPQGVIEVTIRNDSSSPLKLKVVDTTSRKLLAKTFSKARSSLPPLQFPSVPSTPLPQPKQKVDTTSLRNDSDGSDILRLRAVASGTAGGVVGLAVGGPIFAAIGGMGMAYASIQSKGVAGETSRAVGDIVMLIPCKARELDSKHHFVEKTKHILRSGWAHAIGATREKNIVAWMDKYVRDGLKQLVGLNREQNMLQDDNEATADNCSSGKAKTVDSMDKDEADTTTSSPNDENHSSRFGSNFRPMVAAQLY